MAINLKIMSPLLLLTFLLIYHGSSAQSCFQVLTGPSGTIGSTCSYAYTTDDGKCEWLIQVGKGRKITLIFDWMDLVCSFDNIMIHDYGNNISDTTCGRNTKDHFLSAGIAILIHFTPTTNRRDYGFNASYHSTTTGCGANLNETQGAFTSPGYPSGYGNNENCSWTITVDPEMIISLKIITFEVGRSSGTIACHGDNVVVYDGGTTQSTKLGNFCGSRIPALVEATGNSMIIHFTSDYGMRYKGFLAVYNTSAKENSTSKAWNESGPLLIPSEIIITASVLGSLLFFALLVIDIMSRLKKMNTPNTEDQELHMGDYCHYECIDDFLPRIEATLPTASISMNQSMEIMNQSTQSGNQAQVEANIAAAVGQHESEDESDGNIARCDEPKNLHHTFLEVGGSNEDSTVLEGLHQQTEQSDGDSTEYSYANTGLRGIFKNRLLEGRDVGGVLMESKSDMLLDHTYIDVIESNEDRTVLNGPHQHETRMDRDSTEYSYAYTGQRRMFMKRPNLSIRKAVNYKIRRSFP